ncbi:MAG: TIGR01777 family oxidoreductase [bacterium JZ-2024 1]
MKVFVTGGTGFIGKELVRKLIQDGDTVTIATRNPRKASGIFSEDVTFFQWDARNPDILVKILEQTDGVVHLAGETIAQRWTKKTKKVIRDSRVDSTKALADAIKRLQKHPLTFLQASAVGYYGNRGDELLDETSENGKDFLAEVCREWEGASADLPQYGVRRIVVRIGFVLSKNGGGLAKMLLPFRLGLGGPTGSGNQWVSWISLKDTVEAMVFLLKHPSSQGVYNLTAPEPVRNKELARTLGRLLHRPTVFPTPPFFLRRLFGEMADMLLSSQRVIPKNLLALGYPFHHSHLEEGLKWALEI